MSKLLKFFGWRFGQPGAYLDPEPTGPGSASQGEYAQHRHATADFTEAEDDEDDTNDEGRHRYPGQQHGDGYGDGHFGSSNVLPLFSPSHLDSLPVYSITHAIRALVQTRTETTLTWDQLRSPQVSQFLVKPMQQQIRTQHFSRATLYALMANCLQFAKEGRMYPGNAGTSSTRAKVCELLAIKLLKEYSTRELIDALSYDFYPLQGIQGTVASFSPARKDRPSADRTSTLEVAIRASAKKFLAHPLVVQQLEAIWKGAITFYSVADSLHRRTTTAEPLISPVSRRPSDVRTPLLAGHAGKEVPSRSHFLNPGRRTAMLYDPRHASLFKLSRLRVPRYRHILSTLSLGVLILLLLAVLVERAKHITTLELIFWFWSAGFMLDELVGFTEQGFSFYIMSFWNIFDLGILVLLIVYYFMRVYGVFLIDANKWNENAYDVLAAIAILLLPRIFSILDHYPYFSQLLIAFRLMAVDLAAVFVLVLISCSGFFVFFTLSRGNNDAADVAYKIFQILMGFSPAAWELWATYNWLGKLLMGLFLSISHFLVVTILISVLSNSFQSIARNASDEHQFLFAINTVSEIKNDTLFAYIAPGNIFAWALMPLRYCMPLRHFVWLNRTMIKVTHLPILFCIYVYERFFLASSMYEPTDLVENPGSLRRRGMSLLDPASRAAIFSPNVRVREESVIGYQKDRALEEVFRRAPDFATTRNHKRNDKRKAQHAIRTWMDQHEGNYSHSPGDHAMMPDRPATDWRKPSLNKDRAHRLRHLSDVRSIASDPAELFSNAPYSAQYRPHHDGIERRDYALEAIHNTDAEGGDDEMLTNDEDEDDRATNNTAERPHGSHTEAVEEDYFTTPVAARFGTLASTSHGSSAVGPPRTPMSPFPGPSRRQPMHSRTLSTNTILFAPQEHRQRPRSSSSVSAEPFLPRHRGNRSTPLDSPNGRRSPRRPYPASSRPRSYQLLNDSPRMTTSLLGNRSQSQALDIAAPMGQQHRHRRNSSGEDIEAISGLDDAALDAVPASFASQMGLTMAHAALGKSCSTDSDNGRMNQLMLAKMKTLEDSMSEMVREIRVVRSAATSTTYNSGVEGLEKNASSSSGGRPMGESAGPVPRRRAAAKPRLGSRRVTMEEGGYLASPLGKGKGKATAEADTEEELGFDGQAGQEMGTKGSSL